MKKTKTKSKVEFISSNYDHEDSDDGSELESNYDLQTSIEESGGMEKFLKTPCMILYKRNLCNQG